MSTKEQVKTWVRGWTRTTWALVIFIPLLILNASVRGTVLDVVSIALMGIALAITCTYAARRILFRDSAGKSLRLHNMDGNDWRFMVAVTGALFVGACILIGGILAMVT